MSPETKQVIYASASLLNIINVGMACGFPATLVPSLLDPTNDVTTDKHTAAWIASLTGVSGLLTVLSLSPLMHHCGRKKAHLTLTSIIALGWLLTSLSHSIPMLVVARLLHSLCFGAIYFHSVCIGELTSPKVRGYMLGLKVSSVSIGILTVHAFGSILQWRNLALVALVPTISSMLLCLYWPETPEWLVTRHRYEEAKEAFFFIRGYSKESEMEIVKTIAREKHRAESFVRKTYMKDFIEKYMSKVLWRPVCLLACVVALPEFGGRQFVAAYSLQLIEQITGGKNNVYLYTYVLDFINLVASLLSLLVIRKYRRRPIVIVSAIVLIALLASLSLVMYIKQIYGDSKVLLVLSLIIIFSYFIVGFTCLFPAAYTLIGELFPLEYRSIGTLIDGGIWSVVVTFTMRMTPILIDGVGTHGLFLSMATSMAVFLLYVYFELPETKNRTLHDIGEYFRGNGGRYADTDTAVNNAELEIIK